MKTIKYTTVQEREAYCSGYERGMRDGMKKAAMLIQLVASDCEAFEESILQNSKEANELRRIMAGGNNNGQSANFQK